MMAVLGRGFALTTLVCAGAHPAVADATARYACGDRRVEATFRTPAEGPGSVELALDRDGGGEDEAERLVLPQVVSADGGRYADAGTEFWIVGSGATLTRAGSATRCEALS